MVPSGWSYTTINSHIDLLSGFPFKSAEYSFSESDVFLLRGDNIAPNELRWKNAKRWSKDRIQAVNKYLLKPTDLVIAMDRTCVSSGLKVAEVKPSDLPCLLVQRVSRIRAKKTIKQGLLKHLLSSKQFENYIKGVQTETAVPHISAKQIRDFPILLPPLPEQVKIAKILSTWDKAIEITDKLIENSKAQKKALMQQLLTGQRNFPGQHEKWSVYRLHEIADIIVSNVDKKAHGDELPVSLCNYTDVYYNNYITNDLPFMLATATQREVSKFTLQKGDVLITKDSESPNDIAISALVREELSGVLCGYHLAIIRPKANLTDGGFLNSLFSLKSVRYYFSTLANGVTRFGLAIGSIENAIFTIPKLDEQKKIASTLMAQDDKISNLAMQRRFLKKQKQALMQQLLTGKRRVKVNNTKATMAVA